MPFWRILYNTQKLEFEVYHGEEVVPYRKLHPEIKVIFDTFMDGYHCSSVKVQKELRQQLSI